MVTWQCTNQQHYNDDDDDDYRRHHHHHYYYYYSFNYYYHHYKGYGAAHPKLTNLLLGGVACLLGHRHLLFELVPALVAPPLRSLGRRGHGLQDGVLGREGVLEGDVVHGGLEPLRDVVVELGGHRGVGVRDDGLRPVLLALVRGTADHAVRHPRGCPNRRIAKAPPNLMTKGGVHLVRLLVGERGDVGVDQGLDVLLDAGHGVLLEVRVVGERHGELVVVGVARRDHMQLICLF